MNTAPEGIRLESAFRTFQRAANSLEAQHAALSARIARLETSLVDANRRLSAVLDAAEGGLALLDPDGRIRVANPAFERLGLGGEGDGLGDAALRAVGREPAGRAVRLRVDRDGEPRELTLTASPSGDAEGTWVLSAHDVTQLRLEHEEDGRRRRLEALGRMAAELAHEVRNPLGSILLFSSLLRDDLEDSPAQREMADQIVAAVAGLEGTVSNLLAFAAPGRGRLRPLDLAAASRDACALVAPGCQLRGVRLSPPDPGESAPVTGDPDGLRQVVLNLLSNALAATPPGGTVRVETRREGDEVVLEVADTGRGIAPEDLPRVFDPFFSRTDGGTGLGLSIVHQIVARHGGRISLDSVAGRGTTATVRIPSEVAA